MTFRLDQIVPWGRSFDEYVRMFSLTDADLQRRILGCGDGPSSFNAGVRQRAGQAISVDPLYHWSARQIEQRIQKAYPTIIEQLVANQSAYVWKAILSPEDLGRVRMEAMAVFLEDFEEGKAERRYLAHELPELPFQDDQFDLALCSHLLFTYSEQLPAALHCQAMLEMCRVAGEVRVFPLFDMSGQPSPHVDPVCRCLKDQGYRFAIQPVNYEFQRGGNHMLRAWR
jgi:SAM-dependent methyltransferase